MDISLIAILLAASYLCGGVPSGYIVTRWLKGADIRRLGTGNPGAANVYREVGRPAGLLTLAGDMLKGMLPVLAAQRLLPDRPGAVLLCGALAIVGHVWTPYLRFCGGKAVATTAGVFCVLLPAPMAATGMVFLAAVGVSGHISAGSIAGAAAFPFMALAAGSPPSVLLLAFASCALILARHISNLRKLLGDRLTY